MDNKPNLIILIIKVLLILILSYQNTSENKISFLSFKKDNKHLTKENIKSHYRKEF